MGAFRLLLFSQLPTPLPSLSLFPASKEPSTTPPLSLSSGCKTLMNEGRLVQSHSRARHPQTLPCRFRCFCDLAPTLSLRCEPRREETRASSPRGLNQCGPGSEGDDHRDGHDPSWAANRHSHSPPRPCWHRGPGNVAGNVTERVRSAWERAGPCRGRGGRVGAGRALWISSSEDLGVAV